MVHDKTRTRIRPLSGGKGLKEEKARGTGGESKIPGKGRWHKGLQEEVPAKGGGQDRGISGMIGGKREVSYEIVAGKTGHAKEKRPGLGL